MDYDNILKALDYLIDSERNDYDEYMSDVDTDGHNHIYMISLQGKAELLNLIDTLRKGTK